MNADIIAADLDRRKMRTGRTVYAVCSEGIAELEAAVVAKI